MLSRGYPGALIQTRVRTEKDAKEFAGYLDLEEKSVEGCRALIQPTTVACALASSHKRWHYLGSCDCRINLEFAECLAHGVCSVVTVNWQGHCLRVKHLTCASKRSKFKTTGLGASETDQHIKMIATKPDNLSLNPGTHMAVSSAFT